MDVSQLRNYGAAFSDTESSWPPEMMSKMRKAGRRVVMRHLNPIQKLRFAFAFFTAHRHAKRVDLSSIRRRGMRNERFLATQIEYLALYNALARILDRERAVAILKEVMDETAREALLMLLPTHDDIHAIGEPWAVVREYMRPTPAASREAGCLEITFVEDDPQGTFGFDVTWCVWLELARLIAEPEACRPNCHADQLVYPDYFAALGITYQRTQTLACDGTRCDFRFRRACSGVQDPEAQDPI